mmetsp:Transcript_60328/g.140977  ORF Transcript_60328/g.140977 Transcript_60328/m.140977 type:complete len:469 (-) Transcript_60328:55-1461(-)
MVTWMAAGVGVVAVVAGSSPSTLMPCPGGAVQTTACMTQTQYDDVVALVRIGFESLPSNCTGSYCPQADFAGCVLRMAGHDFMDFADGYGGSDGCTDMSDPDNGGLAACLSSGEHGLSLLPMYLHVCTAISLADFLVIAAEAVIMFTRMRHEANNPNAPKLDLSSSFRYGRTTASSCEFAVGRLPDPEDGCDAVERVFLSGMGLDWPEAAALMGVHTLGRAQVSNSGYHGWWSDPENSRQFNNDYYVSLLAKGWIPERHVAGNLGKNQWKRSDRGKDRGKDPAFGHEMMLDTDLCLAYIEDGPRAGPVSAANHSCCAWLTSESITALMESNGGEYCGGRPGNGNPDQYDVEEVFCCGEVAQIDGDCGNRHVLQGPAASAVLSYASNEGQWLNTFAVAWGKATQNGHAVLWPLGQCAGNRSVVNSSTTSRPDVELEGSTSFEAWTETDAAIDHLQAAVPLIVGWFCFLL